MHIRFNEDMLACVHWGLAYHKTLTQNAKRGTPVLTLTISSNENGRLFWVYWSFETASQSVSGHLSERKEIGIICDRKTSKQSPSAPTASKVGPLLFE